MDFTQIVNYILYGFSGACFGIFASRYSVFAIRHIRQSFAEAGLGCLLSIIPQVLLLIVSFLLFPTWFISRTPTGGFFYYLVLIYFFNKGMRLTNGGK